MTDAPVLRAEGLSTGYPGVRISDGLNLEIRPGSFTALVGANGSGKSTLLSTLARILPAHGGRVLLDDVDVHRMNRKAFARTVGMLPQHPSAPEGITVAELAARGRYPHRGLFGGFGADDAAAVDEALAVTGMTEMADEPIGELSGGQRQRVWIAMALTQQPRILMLDEPTSFLDLTHQLEVLELLRASQLESGTTVVTVLHDLTLAARFADTVVVMNEGELVAEGTPVEVLTPEILHEAFGLDAIVIDDPLTGTPLVVPRPGAVRASVSPEPEPASTDADAGASQDAGTTDPDTADALRQSQQTMGPAAHHER